MLESVGTGEGGLPPTIDRAQLEARMADVRSEIEKSEAKRIKVKDIIHETEAQWLPSLYMLWSFPVHSTPRSIEKYLQPGGSGDGIRGFNSAPSEDGLDFALAWGAIVMVAVWTPLTQLFDVDVRSDVEAFEARFREVIPHASKPDRQG
jgi:hypothetical protein